jgi:hypothetical protein
MGTSGDHEHVIFPAGSFWAGCGFAGFSARRAIAGRSSGSFAHQGTVFPKRDFDIGRNPS